MYFVKIIFYLYSTCMASHLRSSNSEQIVIEKQRDESYSDAQEDLGYFMFF